MINLKEIVQTKTIPTVKGLPVIGSTFSFLKDPIELLVNSYKKLGPIFKVKMVNQDIIMMAGIESNIFLSKHANDLLTTKETWGSFIKTLDAETILVALDGPLHVKTRKILMRGYSPEMISGRFSKVIDITEKMLAEKYNKEISTVQFIQRLITEQLGILLANRAPGDYYDHLSYFIRVTLNVTMLKMRPRLALKHPKYLTAKKKIRELSDIIINEHRKNTDKKFPDLIDDLIEAYDQKLISLTPEDMVLAVVGPFFAGMDTVTNTISMTLYALKKHPEILQKVINEVDTIFTDNIPDLKTLKKMEVTHSVILETLRRYPVTPIIPRTVAKDFVFENCEVKKGKTIYMAQNVTHFMPDLFKDPYKFDIDRFSEPRNEHKQKGAYSPYGIGAHRCLGARLGEIQMMLTLATIIKTVNFEIVPKDYEMKMRTLPTIGPEVNFKLKLTPRH